MDAFWVRQRAAELSALADDVRALAAAARQASRAQWESTAAQEFRAALDAEQRRVLAVAALLDEAGAALGAHAHAVEAAPSHLIGLLTGLARALGGQR